MYVYMCIHIYIHIPILGGANNIKHFFWYGFQHFFFGFIFASNRKAKTLFDNLTPILKAGCWFVGQFTVEQKHEAEILRKSGDRALLRFTDVESLFLLVDQNRRYRRRSKWSNSSGNYGIQVAPLTPCCPR